MLIAIRDLYHQSLKFILFLLYSSNIFASSAHHIDFNEAVHYALNANPRITASNASVDAANAAISESRGNSLPKVNLEMNAARSNNPLNVFSYKLAQGNATFADFGAAEFTGPGSINIKPSALDSPGYYSNYNSGVVFKIPLFSGGNNLAKIEKAHHLLSEALHGNQVARNELTFDVLQAYEGAIVTTKLVTIAEQALEAAKKYLETTNLLYQQSIVIQSDVLIAETNLRSAEMTLHAAEAEAQNQLDTFRILIGQPNSDFKPGKPVNIPLPHESLSELEKRAILNNQQLQSVQSHMNASRSEITAAKSKKWPQIDLQVRHDWNSDTLAISSPTNTAMLQFNWEIFSSGSQNGANKHAIAEYNLASAEFDNNANNIRLAVSQAVRSALTAEQQLKTNALNVHATRQSVQILKQQYGRGSVPLAQLLDSQSRLDMARSQQIMACFNMNLASARLLVLLNEFNIASLDAASENSLQDIS